MDRPTYNHTRGDSPMTPCPECRALQKEWEDRLVYDGELGWIDPEDTLESLGIASQVAMGRLHYFNADRSLLISMTEKVPDDAAYYWAQVRLCIDDAERRSKQ